MSDRDNAKLQNNTTQSAGFRVCALWACLQLGRNEEGPGFLPVSFRFLSIESNKSTMSIGRGASWLVFDPEGPQKVFRKGMKGMAWSFRSRFRSKRVLQTTAPLERREGFGPIIGARKGTLEKHQAVRFNDHFWSAPYLTVQGKCRETC